jgi:hypothetical protein
VLSHWMTRMAGAASGVHRGLISQQSPSSQQANCRINSSSIRFHLSRIANRPSSAASSALCSVSAACRSFRICLKAPRHALTLSPLCAQHSPWHNDTMNTAATRTATQPLMQTPTATQSRTRTHTEAAKPMEPRQTLTVVEEE